MPFVDDQGNPVPVQPLAAPPPPVVPLTLADQQAMTHTPDAPPPPPGIDFASAAATAPLPDMTPDAAQAFAGGPPVAPGAPAQPSQVAPVIPIRRAQGAAPAAVAPTDTTFANLDQGIEDSQAKQAAALAAQGETEAAGHEAVAAEKTKVAGIQWRQAAELAAQQQYVRDKQADLNEIDRQNLDYARNKVIPDFWHDRAGEHVGATIGVVLAGLGAGFLGSTQNQAAEIIQHNTDKYFDRKKEEIDNLYKYANAQGLVNDKARDQYAKSLIDLSQQHAAVLDAAKSRVEAVAEESQSPEAKARAAVLASQLTNAATKEHLSVQELRDKHYEMSDQSAASRAKLTEARAAIIRANADAEKARAEANKAKGEAGLEKEIKPISAEFDKEETRLKGSTRSPGLILRQQDVRELGKNLRQAVASRDPQAVIAAAIQAKEKISRLNTGAAPSGHVLEFLNDLQGDPQHAAEKVSKLLGNPKASEQSIGGLIKLIDQADEGALQQIDKERQNVVNKYIGPHGIAKTPAQREHVAGRLSGLFSQTTTRTAKGEIPRYAEGGAGEEPAHPQDNEAVAWAKSHTGDPRAAQILKANGL